MNPIIGMLVSLKTKRFHPIFYLESPLPGNPPNLIRHKSKAHHTSGFETREEAVKCAEGELAKAIAENYGTPLLALADDMVWDEEQEPIPAHMAFFTKTDGGLRRSL